MNYIKKLEIENESLKASLEQLQESIIAMQVYYMSNKFQGVENDYAHVSTDIQPRLFGLKCLTITALNNVS